MNASDLQLVNLTMSVFLISKEELSKLNYTVNEVLKMQFTISVELDP